MNYVYKRIEEPVDVMKLIVRFATTLAIFSAPFWIYAGLIDQSFLPVINLPISALMFVCPFLSVLVLAPELTLRLKEQFKPRRLLNDLQRKTAWGYLLIPLPILIELFSHGAIYETWEQVTIDSTFILLSLVFLITAIIEEIGWTIYLTDLLVKQFSTNVVGIIVGILWALWHIIPYYQTGHAAAWIIMQCISTVASRIVMVNIYRKTRKSFLPVALYHMMINISVFCMPGNGEKYVPSVTAAIYILILIVMISTGAMNDNGKHSNATE